MKGIPLRSPWWAFLGFVAVSTLACATLPPAKSLEPGDLGTLAGFWRGTLTIDLIGGGTEAWREPVEVLIRDDGWFVGKQLAQQHLFGGKLVVEDGQLSLKAEQNTGALVLRERANKRVLSGNIASNRMDTRGGFFMELEAASRVEVQDADLSGTYKVTFSEAQGEWLEAQLTLTQQGGHMRGTWKGANGREGSLTGALVSPASAKIWVSQQRPCTANFLGDASIENGGASIRGSAAGRRCGGDWSTLSFTASRR